MKHFSFLIILFFFSLNNILAQDSTFRFKVIVEDSLLSPIKGANVVIKQLTNKYHGITDTLGECDFVIKKLIPFSLNISHVGYSDSELGVRSIEKDTILNLQLFADSTELNTVTVISQRPFIMIEADRFVINIDNKTIAGKSISDILKMAPGVTINNGQILVEGKPISVQLNNKSIPLTESSLTSYLTSTSATNIEQIEVITTPSSKYDASFSGSIVNLKTKKNYSNGYNGNLGFNSGIRSKYPNGRISGSINFKLNKLNGFLSNGYTVDNQISKGLIERILANSYTPLIKEDNNGLYKPMNYYYTLGMDYSLNNNNSIGLLFNGSYNKTNNDLNNKSHIYGINNKIDSLNQMVSSSIRNSNFRTFDLYYKLKIDTSGQELNIDAALTFLKHTLKGNQKYSYFLPDMTEIKSPSLLIQQTHRNTLIKGFQADYIKPFRSIKFETGIKLSNSLTKQTFNQELNDISLVNNRNLDSINIQENIYALYSSINGKTLSWTYIVGIRGELTEFEIVANNKDANMYKKYFNIFPTILLAKKSNKNDMSISYKRTVVRPRYSQLNYFKYYNSPFYYFMGNPYLQAYYPNTFRFSWIYNKKIQLSVSQTFAKDKIIEYAERDTLNNLTRGLIGNNSSSRSLYISPSYFGNVTNWWYTNSGIGMNLMNLHFSSENIPITKKAVSFDFYSSNTFTITKKIRVESYCYLSSPVYYNAAKTGSFWYLDISMHKDIFKDKGQLGISINDIFYSNITHTNAEYANINYSLKNKWDSRSFNIFFRYNFGKKDFKAKNIQTSATTDDIKNRAN